MNIIIRLACPADALSMAEVHARSWEVAYKDIIPMEYILKQSEKRPALWQRIITVDNKNQYVIELNNKIVGIMCVDVPQVEDVPISNDIGYNESFWELHGIYLHPDYYRLGIGSEAMKFAYKKAMENGAKNMLLWVFRDNVSSIEFYKKCGFSEDGATKTYSCGKDMVCVRMRASLLNKVR